MNTEMFVAIAAPRRFLRIVNYVARTYAELALAAQTRTFVMLADDNKASGPYPVQTYA